GSDLTEPPGSEGGGLTRAEYQHILVSQLEVERGVHPGVDRRRNRTRERCVDQPTGGVHDTDPGPNLIVICFDPQVATFGVGTNPVYPAGLCHSERGADQVRIRERLVEW